MNKKILTLLTLSMLAACGKAPDGPKKFQQEALMPDGSNVAGVYKAELMPVNVNLNFLRIGNATVSREGDTFSATVQLDVGPKNVWHRQGVYSGKRCPNINDDANKDGFIDGAEAASVVGEMVLPLDGGLDSISEGRNQYPTGNFEKGAYTYKRTASFSRMFADLNKPEGIGFISRVIVIQGVAEETFLAPSFNSNSPMSAHKSAIIACGIYWATAEAPVNDGSTSVGSVTSGTWIDGPGNQTPTPTPTPVPLPEPNPEPTDPDVDPFPEPQPRPRPEPTPEPEEEDEDDSPWDWEWPWNNGDDDN